MFRTDFYTKVNSQIGTVVYEELDFLWNTLSNFKFNYTPSYYRVLATDLKRLDTISFKVYDTSEFWWIIALVNDIDNPFLDLEAGQLLTIPNLLDIYVFQKAYRVRRNTR